MDDPIRIAALRDALDMHLAIGDLRLKVGVDAATTIATDTAAVLATAETFAAWLRGSVSIHLHASDLRYQVSGLPVGTPIPTTGGIMQIHDTEQFTLSAVTSDAKGFPTTDPLTWTVDNADAVSLVVSDDTQSCTVVAGNPGSAVVTVTDGTLTATEAVDVVPGGTALISLTEGPVEEQPAPEAPAEPAA
jgi:hypothetical protein